SPPETTKAPDHRGLCYTFATAYFRWVEIVWNLVLKVVQVPLTATMITTEIPAAIRPYSMAVAPDSSFTKRAIRFCIGLNSMYAWLRTNVRSCRRSQHRDRGTSLGSDYCGAVNSIAQIRMEPAVLAHSKCRIKAVPKTQCCGECSILAPCEPLLDSQLLRRERPRGHRGL